MSRPASSHSENTAIDPNVSQKVTPQATAQPSLEAATTSAWADVSSTRKWGLLAIFSMATALDVMQVSSLLTTTETIATDLQLEAGNVTWIITAYSMTFASFLLFSGRLADLIPAQWIFEVGFIAFGILVLISSFVNNKYGFLVLRALTGIAGSMTIPSAYHLIVHLFTDKAQQQAALATLGLTGAVANSLGVILGGLFEVGNSTWKWLFRFFAIVALTSSLLGFLLMPKEHTEKPHSEKTMFQRLDVIGVFLLTSSLLLFILGLTSGTTDGWTSAKFLAPFLLSVFLFVGFFVWETRLETLSALMPFEYWRLPNLKILAFMALIPYMFWAMTQFAFSNYWQVVQHRTPILAAARLLPEGIAGLIGGMVANAVPRLLSVPKWTVLGGCFLMIVGVILQIFSFGGAGNDYWRYVFTGFAIGSFGAILTFLALNVAIIQAMPPHASGVAGALLQVALQIGAVIGLSVQAGLYSKVQNNLSNWHGTQYGFYFLIAWIGVSAIAFTIFYKKDKVYATETVHEREKVVEAET